jgi:2-C-methyl-D-erythritol 4-phosphate cytidylyltransferase/2-C-methyl-D-erythritol 2,4-cyclodiphosphate synthase
VYNFVTLLQKKGNNLDISLVILSAGNSTRFESVTKKQWIRVKNKPLWKFVADRLNKFYSFKETIITANEDETKLYKLLSDYQIVEGGNSRQESLKKALEKIKTEYVLVTDVARACVTKKMIKRLIKEAKNFDCVVPYLPVVDTVIYKNNTIDRNDVKLIQTPQLSKTEILKKALETNKEFTDDSSAIKNIGGKIGYVLGDEKAKKITFKGDEKLKCLKKPSKDIFTGNGYDIHQFTKNKKMLICGVEIESDFGFLAHSDGDVAIHSIIDALLGAAGYGDIGEFFPDNDKKFKNANSKELLKYIVNLLETTGYEIVNIDVTIIAETPKLSPYKKEMKKSIQNLTKCKNINIKATTNEKLDSIGNKKGVAVISNANIKFKENK